MWYLALKHLTSRKRQTVLTLIGVSLGTAVFLVFSAIMTGMQNFIIDQLVNNDSHVRIQAQDHFISSQEMKENLFATKDTVIWMNSPSGHLLSKKILNPLGWYDILNKDPRVFAYSPQLQSQVIYFNSGVSQAGKLTGIRSATQSKVSNIEEYMVKGSIKLLSNAARRVVLGLSLMRKMGARVGDSILVASGNQTPAPFKIVGAFETGVVMIDDTMGFAHISDVQQISGRPSEVSDIVVRLFDVEQAREFADFYTPLSVDKVMSWDQSNANILSVFKLQNLIRSFISVAIMIVAAFGIYNILSILVNQKRKDIGILRSMGYDQSEILRLFLIQGIFLGFLGGALGLVLGYIMSYAFSLIQINGLINKMAVNFSPLLYAAGFFVALFSSMISSILPARSASKLRPIDIVRSSE